MTRQYSVMHRSTSLQHASLRSSVSCVASRVHHNARASSGCTQQPHFVAIRQVMWWCRCLKGGAYDSTSYKPIWYDDAAAAAAGLLEHASSFGLPLVVAIVPEVRFGQVVCYELVEHVHRAVQSSGKYRCSKQPDLRQFLGGGTCDQASRVSSGRAWTTSWYSVPYNNWRCYRNRSFSGRPLGVLIGDPTLTVCARCLLRFIIVMHGTPFSSRPIRFDDSVWCSAGCRLVAAPACTTIHADLFAS